MYKSSPPDTQKERIQEYKLRADTKWEEINFGFFLIFIHSLSMSLLYTLFSSHVALHDKEFFLVCFKDSFIALVLYAKRKRIRGNEQEEEEEEEEKGKRKTQS